MPDRMPTQVEVAISNALLACGTLGFSGGKNRLDAAAELVEVLAHDGFEIKKVSKQPIDPVFIPPLDADEKRLWGNVYAAAVGNPTALRGKWSHVADEAVRDYRHSAKR